MNDEIALINARLAKIEGELIAYQVLFAGSLASVEWRNQQHRSRLRSMRNETQATLQADPTKLQAFTAVVDRIFAELQLNQ